MTDPFPLSFSLSLVFDSRRVTLGGGHSLPPSPLIRRPFFSSTRGEGRLIVHPRTDVFSLSLSLCRLFAVTDALSLSLSRRVSCFFPVFVETI